MKNLFLPIIGIFFLQACDKKAPETITVDSEYLDRAVTTFSIYVDSLSRLVTEVADNPHLKRDSAIIVFGIDSALVICNQDGLPMTNYEKRLLTLKANESLVEQKKISRIYNLCTDMESQFEVILSEEKSFERLWPKDRELLLTSTERLRKARNLMVQLNIKAAKDTIH